MDIRVTLHNPQQIFNRIFTRDAKIYANTRVHALCSPYVPMDTGMLDQNVSITESYTEYKSPYAKCMYYGHGFRFSKEKHPLATSEWDKAMKNARGGQLAREIEQYINR